MQTGVKGKDAPEQCGSRGPRTVRSRESAYLWCPRPWTWIELTGLKFSRVWVMLLGPRKSQNPEEHGAGAATALPSSPALNGQRAPGNS